MQMQLTQGRPDSPEGRLSKELAVYDLLDRLGIDYQRVDHDAAFTMEACLEVDTLLALHRPSRWRNTWTSRPAR